MSTIVVDDGPCISQDLPVSGAFDQKVAPSEDSTLMHAYVESLPPASVATETAVRRISG